MGPGGGGGGGGVGGQLSRYVYIILYQYAKIKHEIRAKHQYFKNTSDGNNVTL